MRRIARFALVVPLIASAATPSIAQENKLLDLLGSSSTPSEMKLKELGEGWKRFLLKRAGTDAGGDMLSQLALMGMASQGKGGGKDGPEAALGMKMLGDLFGGGSKDEVLYSRGDTMRLGEETFLVGYVPEKAASNFLAMMMQAGLQGGKEPDMEKMMSGGKLTGDSTVTLSLVNVRSIGSLSGIRPFNLEKEIAESGKGGFLEMLMPLFAMSKDAVAAPAAVAVTAPSAPRRPVARPVTKPKK